MFNSLALKRNQYRCRKIQKRTSRRIRFVSLMVIVGLLSGIGVAHAYSHYILTRWGTCQTAIYRIQNTFGSTSKSQFGTAMAHWNSKLTRGFLYKSASETSASQPSLNGIKTVTNNTYGSSEFLAEHIPYYDYYTGYVVESDIRFNTSHPFANSALPGCYDVQSIMTHELGHALRVGHSTVYADTMYPYATPNSTFRRSVTYDDKQAARYSTSRWFN